MLQFFIWCDSFDSRKTTQTCLCWVCGEITYLATPSQICSNMSGCQFDRNNCCCVPLLGWCDETWKVFPFLLHVVLQCNVSPFYIVLPFRRHFIQKLIFQLFFHKRVCDGVCLVLHREHVAVQTGASILSPSPFRLEGDNECSCSRDRETGGYLQGSRTNPSAEGGVKKRKSCATSWELERSE